MNNVNIKFIFVISFVFVSAFNPLYAKKQEVLFSPIFLNEGIRNYKDRDLQNAVFSFNKSLSLNSSDISGLLLLGQVYIKDGKPDLAVKTLQVAGKFHPKDALVHYLLGIAYEKNKQIREALAEYRTAIEIEPENILIRAALGNICFLSEDYKCAVDNLENAILAYPLHLRSKLALAFSCHHLKKYALAKEQYRSILDYLPDNAVLWYNLAKSEIALGELDDAKQSIDRSIVLDDSVVEFYLDRAQINYKLSKFEDADNDYLTALRLEPVNPVIPVEYAGFLWKTGAYLKAADQYKMAIELQGDELDLLVNRAYLLQLARQYPEAIFMWNEVLDKDNENQYALFNLAILYQEKEEYEDAINLYKKLISTKNVSKETGLDAKYNLAFCLQKIQNSSEAKIIYSELIKEEPENSNFLYEYGNILTKEKNYKEAVNYLKKAIEQKYEPLKIVYQLLANAYENLNDSENLKIVYKEWLNADKDNADARIAYAKFLARSGATQEAVEQYRVAAALDNTSSSRFKLAQFLMEQKDFYGAIGQLHEYLKSSLNDLNALILLANAFQELGINEQSINTYKKIISIQPDNSLAYFNLGLLYQQGKKSEEAQNYLLKAIELNENYAPAYYALGLSYMALEAPDNNKAKELFEKYLQLDPGGEYKDKAEAFLKEILSKPMTVNQPKV
ncbi:MAG: hypothetical protein A3F80_08670 [Candidatus Melainabacteria bacterium RIFCSPLOWO2_12_FULL_35_11]|nr:MAG: hypothetical protein A3F80_08670 [Candidatus Melainabacteria bacterium RIFCSPLOWO2_12_FULL_35_11]